ncbi:hypothetical protein C0992_009883 [Termitomyces sp. T32_za158]|nr:hypothetical protein C0992_009883 [Termitomyces sp. T32_za158]
MPRTYDWNVGDEHVEVNPTLIPSHAPTASLHHTFQLEPSNSASTEAYRASPETSSPASSDSLLSLENGFPSEIDVVRRGHPAWVARPRNAFIIFRCEYARKHAKQGKRVRHPPGTNTEKTVSKLAAEAWHDLPAEKKDHYKELAEQEKEQHARVHPDYRFRPVKKGTAQKKRPVPVSRSESQPLIPSATTEPAAELMAVPQPSQEQELQIIQPSPQPPQPPVDIALVKAGRRRSASVPLLTIGGNHSFTSGEWATTQPPILKMQRSRSALGNRPPSLSMSSVTSPYYEKQSFDPRMLEVDPSSGYIVPEEFYGTVQNTSRGSFSYPYQYPPSESLTAAADSTHISPSWSSNVYTPEAATSWSSSPPTDLRVLQPQGSFSEYSGASDAFGINEVMTDNLHEESWEPASNECSYLSVEPSLGLDRSGMLFSHATLYNGEIANDYSQIVGPHTVETQIPEDAMFALNINDYLH